MKIQVKICYLLRALMQTYKLSKFKIKTITVCQCQNPCMIHDCHKNKMLYNMFAGAFSTHTSLTSRPMCLRALTARLGQCVGGALKDNWPRNLLLLDINIACFGNIFLHTNITLRKQQSYNCCARRIYQLRYEQY